MSEDGLSGFRALRISTSEETASAHLASIDAALATRSEVMPRRRRLMAALASLVVLGLPATAVAAEDSVPGDALYPMKRAVESVWVVFDGEIPARHRLDELERLMARGADQEAVEEAVERARLELNDVDDPGLRNRFRRLRAGAEGTSPGPAAGETPAEAPASPATDPPRTTTTTVEERDAEDGGQHSTGSAVGGRTEGSPRTGSTVGAGGPVGEPAGEETTGSTLGGTNQARDGEGVMGGESPKIEGSPKGGNGDRSG